MKKRSCASIVLGAGLVLLGIGYIGNIFGWWSGFTLFFPGWWTLFIILPCFIFIVDRGPQTASVIGLIIGIVLLMSRAVASARLSALIVPIILVAVGIVMILRNSMFKYRRIINEKTGSSTYIPVYNAFLNSRTVTLNGDHFEGASVTTMFGGVLLDISNTVIDGDVLIDVTTIFASASLKLPSNVNVSVSNTPILGSVDNHAADRKLAGAPTVYISGSSIFAGLDIR